MGKKRAGSVDAAAAALQNAYAADVQPPGSVKLRDADWPIWVSIVRARARDEWSEIDLYHAANLTRCLSDIERISGELAERGDTYSNDRGTMCVNPKHSILETLSRRGVALTRLLHLHAQALVPDLRKLGPVRETEQKGRETRKQLEAAGGEDDGLLATPVRH